MLILYEFCRWNSIWFVYVNSDAGVKCHCCSEFVMVYEQLVYEQLGKKITRLDLLVI